MFEPLQTFAANRFRWKRTSSHRFSEEDTKRIFGFNNRMLRRCHVQCLSSPTYTFELKIKFDLSLAKYIFQIKNLKHSGHEVKLDPDERRFRSDLKENQLKMLRYLGLVDTSLASAEVALHREFPDVHFDISLVQHEVRRLKTEGRNSEDTNVKILMKSGQQFLAKEERFEIQPKILERSRFAEMYNVMSKFQDHEQQTFLKYIIESKRSMYWIFVKKSLTFGHASTQRVEVFHAKFKGKDKLSLKQKGWTIDQLVSYHDKQVEDYTRSTLEKIKKLVIDGYDVAEDVCEMLTVELKKVHDCFIS
eukprot:augustus_masked-scaffold_3-processed-gene-6.52-mRNA-1 protein AED:1.00 eAED:1.00 QI:0/0/0/0/1/1/3/0/304